MSKQGQSKYLGIIRLVATGGQVGIDQLAMLHAHICGVPVTGFVPDGNTAQVRGKDGKWVDKAGGIPEEMLEFGRSTDTPFTETTVANVESAINDMDEKTRGLCQHLLQMARENPAKTAIRTELQVATTDLTLILTTPFPASDGTASMEGLAGKYDKPCLVIRTESDGSVNDSEAAKAQEWIRTAAREKFGSGTNPGLVLNIGGPRAAHEEDCGWPVALLGMRALDAIFQVDSAGAMCARFSNWRWLSENGIVGEACTRSGLSPNSLKCVLRETFQVNREFVREKFKAFKEEVGTYKTKSAEATFAARMCISPKTIERAISNKENRFDGGSVLCVALGLGCRFFDLVHLPEESPEVGRKHRRPIPKLLRVMYSKWPALTSDGKTGIVPELVSDALKGRTLESELTDDSFAVRTFCRSEPPSDILICSGDHRLGRERLSLAMHLVRIPIGLLANHSVAVKEIAENLFNPSHLQQIGAKVAVFHYGFAHFFLEERGFPGKLMKLVRWPDETQEMIISLESNDAQFTIANLHSLEAIMKRTDRFDLWPVPVGYAEYSAWVHKGDYGMAKWFRKCVAAAQDRACWQKRIEEFNEANHGSLEIIRYAS